MMHDETHDALLAALLAGEVGEDASEARVLLEECDVCRERWSTLAPLVEEIVGVVQEQREVLAAAATEGPAPGSERVAPVLAGLRDADRLPRPNERDRAQSRRWTRGFLAALAASFLIAVLWRSFASHRSDPHDDVILGSGEITPILPKPETSVFDVFEWSYPQPLPAGGHAELVIIDPGNATRAEREIERKRVEGNRWSFTPAETEGWPDRIEWQVFVYGGSGDLIQSSARFSSRRLR